MNRIVPPIASTVLAASFLLLSVAFVAISVKEGPTPLGFAYGLEAVILVAGWLPVLAREAVQDWRMYMKSRVNVGYMWVIAYEKEGEPRRYVNEHGDEYVKDIGQATLYATYDEARASAMWHRGEKPMTVAFALSEDWIRTSHE